ncbi:MAG TPA: FtsX-like permease family protein, partial [Sedimentisphaerales bacterium]|nr:FtsX-like permease family protein [Sedimentisphaerales bacterium]
MLKLFLWLRYMRRVRIVLLSVAAVAVSAALMIVVSSLFTGFIRNVERHSGATLGDICISADWGRPIPQYDRLIEKLEKLPSVKAAAPMSMSVGLVHLGGGNVQQVAVIGINPEKEDRVTNLIESIRHGGHADDAITFVQPSDENVIPVWIGIRAVAEPDPQTDTYDFSQVDSFIGQQAVLITGSVISRVDPAQQSRSEVRQKTLRLEIQGIVHSGHYLNDQNLYIPLADLQKLIHPEETEPVAARIKIRLADGVSLADASRDVGRVWHEFSTDVLDWPLARLADVVIITTQEMFADYFAELHKQMGVLILIFGVISSVGILLVFCVFYMIVMARRKDIGIIKSCGAGNLSVASVFLGFAACVGLVGSACGVALGWLIITNINHIEGFLSRIFGWKIWRSSVYIFEQ